MNSELATQNPKLVDRKPELRVRHKYGSSSTSSAVSGDDMHSLIVENVGLVKYVVGKMQVYFKRDDEQDIIGYGIVGLIESAKRFDRTKGVKFNTFAVPRIRGAIIDYLRTVDMLPRSLRRKESEIRALCVDMERRMGREPSPEEIALELGISEAEFFSIQTKLNFDFFVSLENMCGGSDDDQERSVANVLEDKNTRGASEILEDREEKTILLSLLENLPRQERLVITLYYLEDMLLKEISKVLGVSESRISQLHHKALFYLRTRMNKVYE